jgi:uncharacterized protein with HEPN domain
MNDAERIHHMLDAAQSALAFCEGMDEAAFESDERTQRAVVQCIQVIGEAARHVSDDTRQQLPAVPWNQVVGMRHRMIHVYFYIDVSLVWQVVEHELEPMVNVLRHWQAAEREG